MGSADLSAAVLVLSENLQAKSRSRVVDPLIASLTLLVAARFRRQSAWWLLHGGIAGFAWDKFAPRYQRLMQRAWDGGGAIAAADLGIEAPVIGLQPRSAFLMESEIDGTTVNRVRSFMRDAVERGLTRPQMEREFRGMFREWAQNLETSRSGLIASNEIDGAFNRGMMAAARASGLRLLKQWWADPGACALCLDNVEDPIELDEPFASGDFEPQAHIGCRCSLKLSYAD